MVYPITFMIVFGTLFIIIFLVAIFTKFFGVFQRKVEKNEPSADTQDNERVVPERDSAIEEKEPEE